ncbi:tyrosine-type recombinase/integrase [Acinetobacter piscicola]|uniref:tyrosine-type recombinase/integrase n=1 Tax=Acinetobacter piscicola TaxID=2006115 RepID=UPI00102053FF|nr:site-specific integrase [Acinetobacter piscicola]RYL25942.1 site-specific integrase [Acinetobacter piscicola]
MSLSIYKNKNGGWRGDLEAYGQRKSKVKKTKAEVQRWAQEMEREFFLNYSTDLALNNKIVLTVDEALTRYMNEVSKHKKTAKKECQRIKYYKNNLPFVDWPLVNYKPEFLKQWEHSVMNRSIRPLSASSVLRDYSTLSAFFNWCRLDKGWIDFNPVQNIRKPKKPEHRDRRTEIEELQGILSALKYVPGTVPTTKMQEVGLIWLIAMATGMRSGEIVNRPINEVFINKRYIYLPDTKNGTSRKIPLDDFALQLWSLALKIDRKNSPKVFTVSDGSRDTLFRKAKKMAGLEHADLTFHDSRHEAASLMAKRIKNALTLCKIFGWKDPKNALIYYNPTNDEILEELNMSQGLSKLLA